MGILRKRDDGQGFTTRRSPEQVQLARIEKKLDEVLERLAKPDANKPPKPKKKT
jgi:hypothetical protein